MQTQRFSLLLVLLTISFFCLQCTSNTSNEEKEKGSHPHAHEHGNESHSQNSKETNASKLDTTTLLYPEEKHFKNMRQLTFGGDNAEAYFSYDDTKLVLQVTNKEKGIECDQIFYAPIPTSPKENFDMQLVSTGKGRTTCSFFMPGDKSIIYASTHQAGEACPPPPDRRKNQSLCLAPLSNI